MEDCKKVIWSNETKINCLGSDGRTWVWKKAEKGLYDRVIEGVVKFRGAFRGVCYGKRWRMPAELMEGWMQTFIAKF